MPSVRTERQTFTIQIRKYSPARPVNRIRAKPSATPGALAGRFSTSPPDCCACPCTILGPVGEAVRGLNGSAPAPYPRSRTQRTGMAQTATKETLGFQAEVKQLLHLMIHSLYGNK